MEAAVKYGETTKNTTEYSNPIIKSNVKKPNLILEYIEHILQVHYPDGTTKSTALPPRFQTADGKEPNINPEQLKTIRDQMTKSFNLSISEYEKDNNRSNSVTNKKISYSKQKKNMNKDGNDNVLKQANSNKIKYDNNNNINNSNGINAVRSAMKSQSNVMTYNSNLNNIKAAKTAFDNSERGTTNSNISNKNKNNATSDNYRQNPYYNKGMSEYSISSVPNKPLTIISNYGTFPKKKLKIKSII